MKYHCPLLMAVVALVAAGSSAQANMIVNGSFESPLVQVGSYVNYLGGSTAITGWTVVGVDSSIASGSFVQSGITFNAQEGQQWIDLAGITSNNPTSGVTQSVTTTIGTEYELTFYVGSALDVSGTNFFFPTTVDLSINGGARTSYFNPASPTNMLDWKLFTVDFTATSSTTSITFLNGAASNNYLTGLDNIALEELPASSTPVPSTLVMSSLLFGTFAGVGLCRHKRRRIAH